MWNDRKCLKKLKLLIKKKEERKELLLFIYVESENLLIVNNEFNVDNINFEG